MFPSLVVGRSRSPDSQIDASLRLPGQTCVWTIQWLIATSLPGHSGEDRAGLTPASLDCRAELSSVAITRPVLARPHLVAGYIHLGDSVGSVWQKWTSHDRRRASRAPEAILR